MDRFREGGFKIERGVPGTEVGRVEPAAVRSRMAKGGHDGSRMRPANDPFIGGEHMDDAKFRRNAVVGPTLEFKDKLEILRQGHNIQHAYRRKPAWDQPVGVLLLKTRNRWRQFQPPRRASSSRRVR